MLKIEIFGTVVKLRIHALMEDEKNNTIQKKENKITNFQTQEILQNTCDVFVSIYGIFQVFALFSLFVHTYFDSCTTPS